MGGGRKPFQEQPEFLVASDLNSQTEPWTLSLSPAPSCSLGKQKKKFLLSSLSSLCRPALPCWSSKLIFGHGSSQGGAAPLHPQGLFPPNPHYTPGLASLADHPSSPVLQRNCAGDRRGNGGTTAIRKWLYHLLRHQRARVGDVCLTSWGGIRLGISPQPVGSPFTSICRGK